MYRVRSDVIGDNEHIAIGDLRRRRANRFASHGRVRGVHRRRPAAHYVANGSVYRIMGSLTSAILTQAATTAEPGLRSVASDQLRARPIVFDSMIRRAPTPPNASKRSSGDKVDVSLMTSVHGSARAPAYATMSWSGHDLPSLGRDALTCSADQGCYFTEPAALWPVLYDGERRRAADDDRDRQQSVHDTTIHCKVVWLSVDADEAAAEKDPR